MSRSQLKKSDRARRKRNPNLAGVCSGCGRRSNIVLQEWHAARREDRWPACKGCGSHIYPAPRRCVACGAHLRNGNLGEFCALCERKQLESGE